MDEAVISDIDQRISDLQQLLAQEMQVRAAADEDLSRKVTEQLSKQMAVEARVDSADDAQMKKDIAEIKMLLEAEVEARCAVMERLDKQLHDQHAMIKACQTSASVEKLQLMIDGYSQKLECTNLQVEMFREDVKALTAEAQKHVQWVESQREKTAARQDLLEKGLQELTLRVSNSSREITKLENEFSSIVKLLQSDMTNLVSSSHSNMQEELRKIRAVVEKAEGRYSEPAPIPRYSEPSSIPRHSEPTTIPRHSEPATIPTLAKPSDVNSMPGSARAPSTSSSLGLQSLQTLNTEPPPQRVVGIKSQSQTFAASNFAQAIRQRSEMLDNQDGDT